MESTLYSIINILLTLHFAVQRARQANLLERLIQKYSIISAKEAYLAVARMPNKLGRDNQRFALEGIR